MPIFLLFLLFASTHCLGVSAPTSSSLPWFTGPLLTPTARVLKAGSFNLEPYVFYIVTDGNYDEHWHAHSRKKKLYHLNVQHTFKLGLGHSVDLSGTIQSSKKWTKDSESAGFGDQVFGFDFQLIKGDAEKGIPFIKLSILEIFPVGRHDQLHQSSVDTESFGRGAFGTTIGLTGSHLFKFSEVHYLNLRTHLSTTLFCSTHISGVSAFGGDPTTCGRVHPGSTFNILVGAEYSLTNHWALAIDFNARFAARSRFKGHTVNSVRERSTSQISLAPAIEYNWNEVYGLIVGSWFTLAGRNASRFYSIVAGFNCNF